MNIHTASLGALFTASILASIFATTAFAHVTVQPSDVSTATYQVFTVSVPNEKEIPTTSVKLDVPANVTNITPTNKAGWRIDTEKNGSGENAAVTSITWSDGTIKDGLRDEFTFSAKTPDSETELKWKAYQTYSDGTVVSWDKEESSGGHSESNDSGPLSVTKVSEKTTATTINDNSAVADAQISADRAMYVAAAATLVGITGIYFATKRK